MSSPTNATLLRGICLVFGILLAGKVVVGLLHGDIDYGVGRSGGAAAHRIHLTTMAGLVVGTITIGSVSIGLLLTAYDPCWVEKHRWALGMLLGAFLGGLAVLHVYFE